MKYTENKNQDSKVESPPWRIFRNKERRIIRTYHRMPIIIIEGRAVQFRAKRKISEFPVAIIKIIRKDGTFRPTPCVCAGCSGVWLNRKSAGHPSSFVPLLLPASWLPEAALRIMGVHTHSRHACACKRGSMDRGFKKQGTFANRLFIRHGPWRATEPWIVPLWWDLRPWCRWCCTNSVRNHLESILPKNPSQVRNYE